MDLSYVIRGNAFEPEHCLVAVREHRLMLSLLSSRDSWSLAQACVDHMQYSKNQYLGMLLAQDNRDRTCRVTDGELTWRQVSFTRMSDGTAEDFSLLHEAGKPYVAGLPDRILAVLGSMRDAFPGYQITSLDHLLQTASRAERDGAEEEMIVAALLHDIGDVFAPHNHAEFGAAVIRPYVSERTHWIIEHHAIFQLYHYGQHVGCDPLLRDRFRKCPLLRRDGRILCTLGSDLVRSWI